MLWSGVFTSSLIPPVHRFTLPHGLPTRGNHPFRLCCWILYPSYLIGMDDRTKMLYKLVVLMIAHTRGQQSAYCFTTSWARSFQANHSSTKAKKTDGRRCSTSSFSYLRTQTPHCLLNLLMLGPQGRVEQHMNNQGEGLKHIRQAINLDQCIFQATTLEGTSWTAYADDDKRGLE